ncbi:MAG: hypothetical protein AAF441_12045 [Pseudomonadota bacterium]
MPIIFISHASVDKPRLEAYIDFLLKFLEDSGRGHVKLWVDKPWKVHKKYRKDRRLTGIPIQAGWRMSIADAISRADCTLAFWSQKAAAKPREVLWEEIYEAAKAQKLVQVSLDSLDGEAWGIPRPFSYDQILDLSDAARPEDSIEFGHALDEVVKVLDGASGDANTAVLPYLVDRLPQEHKFAADLENLPDNGLPERRPILVLVRGFAKDEPVGLAERLVNREVSRLLPSDTVSPVDMPMKTLDWPNVGDLHDAEELRRRVRFSFARALDCPRLTDFAEVRRVLSDGRRNIFVSCSFGHLAWSRGGSAVVREILECLRLSPDIPGPRIFVLFLCVQERKPSLFARWPFRRKPDRAVSPVQAQIERYLDENDNAFTPCTLPKLSLISEQDVSDWLGHKLVKPALADPLSLRHRAAKLFTRWLIVERQAGGPSGIRMGNLVRYLRGWLRLEEPRKRGLFQLIYDHITG